MRIRRHPRLTALTCAAAVGISLLTGCAQAPAADAPTKWLSQSVLPGALLSAGEIDAVMATTGMTAHPAVEQMADHRNLLPNLDCLGVWQVNEAPIYDPSDWQSVRQQMLRTPDTDSWDALVVQSVVLYRSPEDANRFFTESADRWSKCTNHRVNIRLNDQPLPAWMSGDLSATDSRLTMPYVRGSGDQTRSCERALAVAANAILDIQACKPQQSAAVTQAGAIAEKIEAKMLR